MVPCAQRARRLAEGLAAALLAALPVALPLGCCGGAPAAPSAPVPRPPPCSANALAAFDPGLEVRLRAPLPSAVQRLSTSTDQVVVIACEPSRSRAGCRATAERRVRRAFPRASRVRSELVATEVELVAELRVGAARERQRFDSPAELAALLRARVRAGEVVRLERIDAVAAPDAPLSAVVTATVPGPSASRAALRAELLLAPPAHPAVAMRTLQARAARAGLRVHAIEPQAGGALRVEVGCVVGGEAAAGRGE